MTDIKTDTPIVRTKSKKGQQYEFRIDRYKPETIPMARLALYMGKLATLLGEHESVHFSGIRRGSVRLCASVEYEAQPKVQGRVQALHSSDPPEDLKKQFDEIDEMLRLDNAAGSIKRGTAVVLKFPGRTAVRPPRIGPFSQPTELVGQLVRIGGRDQSSHGQIEDSEGRVWSVTMTRDQARDLAPLLYGTIIRVSGPGRWERTEHGVWQLDYLKLTAWEKLTSATLRESVTELRQIEGSDWQKDPDPETTLARIRGGEEVH